jgi:hypothetical protein
MTLLFCNVIIQGGSVEQFVFEGSMRLHCLPQQVQKLLFNTHLQELAHPAGTVLQVTESSEILLS